MTPLDWIIVAAYVVFALGLGLFFAGKAGESMENFFLSGRSLPWWLAGVSIVATQVNASFPIKISAMVREYGVAHNWLHWYAAPGYMLIAIFLAPLWRRARILTELELNELRYSGRPAAGLRLFMAVLQGIFMNAFWLGMNLIAMAAISQAIMPDVDPMFVVASVCLIATIYAVLSGLYGVVATDLLQYVLAVAGCIGILVVIYLGHASPAELPAQVEALAGMEGFTSMVPQLPDAGAGFHVKMEYVNWLVYVGVLWLTQAAAFAGYLPQRMMAVKDERESTLSVLCVPYLQFTAMWPWMIIGLASLLVLGTTFSHQAAFPQMAVELLPTGLRGLFIAAMLASMMSTVDTRLNMGASFICNDIYKRFLRPQAREREFVLISRISTVILMVLTFFFWLLMMRGTAILDNFKLGTLLFAGLGPLLLVRWFWWRVNAWAEISAMVASFVLMIVMQSGIPWLGIPNMRFLITDYYAIGMLLVATLATFVWIPVAFLAPGTSKEALIEFYSRVRPPGPGWRAIAKLAGLPPKQYVNWRHWLGFVAAVVSTYAFAFGLGKALMGQMVAAGGLGVLFLAALLLALRLMKSPHWTVR